MPPQVWHSGTLASNLVGSTRRVTVMEVDAMAAEKQDNSAADSDDWWWDIDTGGKLMVRGRGGGC